MGHKKFVLVALVSLLVVGVASVSACTPGAIDAPGADLASPSELPAPGMYGQDAQGIVQAVPVWEQVNSNGFGDPGTSEVTALESFNGYLYAGTFNPIDFSSLYDGAQIFRSPDGVTWTPVTQPGFGNTHDIAPPAVLDFITFNNQLYASTGRGNASQIWRTSNGTTWTPMDVTGFSDPDNVDITALAVYNGKIYAGVRNQVTGAQIWSSFTGDNNSWTQVAPAAPGTMPARVTGFAEFSFDGGLYAAVELEEGPAQIWRSYGGDWEVLVNDGFGDANTLLTGGMTVFGGNMYAGAGNTADGAQLWRSPDGTNWVQAISSGYGDPNNRQVEMVFVFQNQLYVSVKNAVTGMEIWRSADGTLWEQANQDGFGDRHNSGSNWSNATADFLGQLYVGTSNAVDGGELWRMLQQLIDTPTSTSTNTPTITPSYSPTYTPTLTVTETSVLTAIFTATDTLTLPPTFTPAHTPTDNTPVTFTFTPTSTPTLTPAIVPTNIPTHTPSPAVVFSTPGKVTGGGNIDQSSAKVTFGFVIRYDAGAANPQGNLTFMDHSGKLSLKATSFDMLVIEGNQVRFTGVGVTDEGQIVEFEVEIDVPSNLDQPNRPDTFYISISAMNEYRSGGALTGGNITIHK